MNNGLGFQLANVPTITGLASVQANDVTTDTIEVNSLTIDGVDITTTLNDKVSKTLNNTVTGINTFSNPLNVFWGDGANLTNVPAPANMVTTNTTQTITAQKTFNTDIFVATDMKLGHGNNNISTNVCLGAYTLMNATTAGEQIAIGTNALQFHNGGNGNNVAIGSYTLQLGTNPYNNVAIGRNSLNKATFGAFNNIGIGADTLPNLTTGQGNFCAGSLALAGCFVGLENVAIGFVSLINTNTDYCVGIGSVAGAGNRRPYNVYIGRFAGYKGEYADGIVAIGAFSLQFNNISALRGEGHYNTGIGYNAGGTNQKVGVNNTFIGAYTDIDTLGNWANSTAIGYGATITASNQIMIGRASETVSIPGNLNVSGTITNSDLTFLSGTQTIIGAKTMNNVANVFYGDGSNLTGIVATNATNVNLTVDDSATVYYPVFAASGAGNKPLLYDTSTTPLSYQPSTSTLKASIFSIPTTVASTISATGTTLNITNGNAGGANIITGLTNFVSPNITLNSTNNFNVGHGAGGTSNTCIGYATPRSIVFTTGSNSIVGSQAGQNLNTSAESNSFFGTLSGAGQTTGNYNTYFGSISGNQVSGTGWRNTAIGYACLDGMTTIAENNTACGAEAGGLISTGYNNTLIGWGAGGSITTGANNICIGALSAPSSATAQNEINIGSASETMFIKGGLNFKVGTQITNSTNGNLVGLVLAQFYTVAMTAASQTITLPNPTTAAYLGARVTFKRKTNTTVFTFTAAGTTPFLGVATITPSASPTSIAATIFQVDMVCDGTNWCFISTA